MARVLLVQDMIRISIVPSVSTIDVVVPPGGSSNVGLYVSVYDDDTSLPELYAKVEVDWGDGYPPTIIGSGSASIGSPLTANISKVLSAGLHVVKISASNRRSPVSDVSVKTVYVKINEDKVATQEPSLVGPIIPRDEGFPSQSQWMLDSGSDDVVIASNIKALLLTSPGDRVMTPEYGVNLRQLVFSLDVRSAETLAKAEIARAVSLWENRAVVRRVSISKTGTTHCDITVELESKLSRQHFTVSSRLAA